MILQKASWIFCDFAWQSHFPTFYPLFPSEKSSLLYFYENLPFLQISLYLRPLDISKLRNFLGPSAQTSLFLLLISPFSLAISFFLSSLHFPPLFCFRVTRAWAIFRRRAWKSFGAKNLKSGTFCWQSAALGKMRDTSRITGNHAKVKLQEIVNRKWRI